MNQSMTNSAVLRTTSMTRVALLLLAGLFLGLPSSAQIAPHELEAMRNDPRGDIRFKRAGVMDGNLVRTLYFNQGEVGNWPNQPSGEWPKGTGQSYLDGVAVLVGAEFTTPNGTLIQSVATAYREWMDQDPVTGLLWGWSPVPGYLNPASEIPAISNQPSSWPSTWPAALSLTPEWDGFWYGYFGRGVFNADLETFFVMDDAQDAEFSRPPYNYFPLASDRSRLGMGLRVEVRGFQWSHVLAEDNIFFHYDIVNLSDRDYERTAFGFYTDLGIGGTNDSADDMAFYSVELDIAYGFDGDGIGTPGAWSPVGYMGYAYLESPGNPYSGIDNDLNGIIDERRDSGPGQLIEGQEAIRAYVNANYNMANFERYFGPLEERPAYQAGRWWTGDEDMDWRGFTDLNGNGVWDPDEPLNDDLGRDGVGPYDLHYTGPDEGEGDGIPTAGEPNFDATDKDESDQIGLQSLAIYRLVEGGGRGPGGDGGWPRHDDGMWQKMTSHQFDTELQRANISMVFGSGPFELRKATRERFSMALIFGSNLDDLTFNTKTVKEIYNANYNFAQPPLKPRILAAVAGDRRVALYWDSISEQSYDRFLQEYDFEGYLIYRSTEPEFNDIKVVTDSRGDPKFWKPIAQFDLKNGIVGPDPIGINGAHFWRGSDTGLQHSFVDTTVTNGIRYYYAVVAYDRGAPDRGTGGLPPSETTKIIREDFAGNVLFTDVNTAIVTPSAPVAGYVAPGVQGDLSRATGRGSGTLQVELLNPQTVPDGAAYRVVFGSTGNVPAYRTDTYSVIRTHDGVEERVLDEIPASSISKGEPSMPFDGIVFRMRNDSIVAVDPSNTGWLRNSGGTALSVVPHSRVPARAQPWPADYEVRFEGDNVYTTPFFRISTPFTIWNKTDGYQADFEILNEAGSGAGSLAAGDPVTIIEYVSPGQYRFAWDIVQDGTMATSPATGDRYQIATRKPFLTDDYFEFTTTKAFVSDERAAEELSNIAVVPNPYVGAASWERRTRYQTGRGERRIEFIHLPQQCTIRIYTVSGALIKTLEHDSSMLDGSIDWDLVSDDGMDIAFGVYIFHVNAPGIGEHVGKFAVIK
jgi:hypothetical protein